MIMQKRWCDVTKTSNVVFLRQEAKKASISCHFWGHVIKTADGHTIIFSNIPTVTVAKAKSNDDALVEIIRKTFGLETFTSRQLAKHAETDNALLLALGGKLGNRSIGTKLRDIKSIQPVAYGRHIASWKAKP